MTDSAGWGLSRLQYIEMDLYQAPRLENIVNSIQPTFFSSPADSDKVMIYKLEEAVVCLVFHSHHQTNTIFN